MDGAQPMHGGGAVLGLPPAAAAAEAPGADPDAGEDAISLGRAIMSEFLRSARAYDILPESNKVVVFDVTVPVKLAFYALVEHDTMCAPLWDSSKGDYAGVLTSSDICDIMRIFYSPGTAASALSELTIAAWRQYAGSIEGMRRGLSSPQLYQDVAEHAPEAADATDVAMGSASLPLALGGAARPRRPAGPNRPPPSLISIHPEDDLLTVSNKLRQFGIHHMPVLDREQSAVIGVLSHRSLMAHVIAKFTDTRRVFDVPLDALGVGSFADIVVVPETASVISVLNVLAERRISSVPLVAPDSGALVDVYSRDDVAFLANDASLMVLDAPVGDVRRAQTNMTGMLAPLITCSKSDTLHHALELFAAAGGLAERLFCVDEARRVTGIISLSDIFAYFSANPD